MDWTAAIDRNREVLLGIVSMLFAAAGIARGGIAALLPRRTRFMILRSLRAAESAARRLVVIQASQMTLKPRPKRPAPASPIPRGNKDVSRLPSFPLFDPRKRFGTRRGRLKNEPRISSVGYMDPVFAPPKPEPTPDDLLDSSRLSARLETLVGVLEDLPKQARRLLRAQAQRKHAPPGPRRVPALRPGWPPGYRQRHRHPVDQILYDCHCLARHALDPPRRQTS